MAASVMDAQAGATTLAESIPPTSSPSLAGGATRLAASQGFQLVVRLGTSVALARLLAPRDFGLMGLVGVLTVLLQRTLGDGGMVNALVQRREVSRELASSVFWFNIAIGITTTALLVVAAPVVSSLLGDRDATNVIRGMALTFVVGSAMRVPNAMIRRAQQYGRLAIIAGINATVNAAVAIPLAVAGHGVASMVVAAVTAVAVELVVTWSLAGWRPLLLFRRSELRSVTSFARNLMAFNLVNYFADAGDKFIVGRFVGTGALGLYSLPYRVLFAPVYAIAQVYRDLLFPVFSRNQDDNDAIGRAYLRAVGAMSLVSLPLCAITAALAGPLVDATLGAKWHEAGPILSVMAVVALQQSVLVTGSIILTAKGRTDILLRWGVAAGLTLFGFYGIGALWGAMGVAVGFLLGTTVLAYPAVALPFREIDLPVRRLVSALRPALLASTSLTAGAVAARVIAESASLPAFGVVAVGTAAGGALYAITLIVLRPVALRDLLAIARGGRG